MSILARASLTKSSSILIFLNNLFHTYPAPNNGVEEIQRSSDWLTEYLWGSSQQIYSLPIPKAFVGKRFGKFVDVIHQVYDITIFAIVHG